VRTDGVLRNNGAAPQRTTGIVGRAAPRRGTAGAGSGIDSGFAARANGDDVGTTSRGGQAVFASSASKKKGKASNARTAPSSRSAAGDLWSGFRAGERSSVFAAQASAGGQGLSGTATAALAFLGIGLTGLAGAAGFLVLRGRRSKAQSTAGGSGSTEM
jgi:hypothetical protein